MASAQTPAPGSWVPLVEVVPCAVCGQRSTAIVASRGRGRVHATTVVCKGCGLVYLNPRMDENTHREHADDPIPGDLPRKEAGGRPVMWLLQQEEALVEQQMNFLETSTGLPRAGKVLDLGSGPGIFLGVMKKRGWDAEGVEADPDLVRFTAATTGITVAQARPEDWMPKGAYDLIRLSHVLDRFRFPKVRLLMLARHVSGRGALLIETADVLRLPGEPEDVFTHLRPYSFSNNTLSRLLAETGFEPVAADPGAPGLRMAARNNPAVADRILEFAGDPWEAVMESVAARRGRAFWAKLARAVGLGLLVKS